MEVIKATKDCHYTGHCHCGAVQFAFTGPVRPIVICHCDDCLRISGYSWAATAVPRSQFQFITGEDAVSWYRSSETAARGFCQTCHAHLFFHLDGRDAISVAPGMMDNWDGIYCSGHIYRDNMPTCCAALDELSDLDNWSPTD